MLEDSSRISSFLKELTLFNSLDEAQLSSLVSWFNVIRKEPDESIITEGDQGEYFYIILEGNVAVTEWADEKDYYLDVLAEGDFFGEEALLLRIPAKASVKAVSSVVLLQLDQDRFHQLIGDFPAVRDHLIRFIRSRAFVRRHRFNWLGDDEVVYQVRRRHPIVLLQSLLWPVLVLLVGFIVASISWLISESVEIQIAGVIAAAVIIGIGLGWSIWRLIDWGNDYYLVTSQRVVWFERVIWFYESRMEAPLDTLLSINVTTEFIGRLLGFGNVIVTTYTGKIVLSSVDRPYQLASLIGEYWNRAKRNLQKSDYEETQKSIRRMLGRQEPNDDASTGLGRLPARRRLEEPQEPSFWDKYFGNIFKTRIQQGNVITYRKHWYVLLKKAGWPTLLGLVLFFLSVSFVIMYVLGTVRFISPVLVCPPAMLILLLIVVPWWIYGYIDWRNDIYQVTDKSIFDIERKPLGTEVKKSAALENILSLEHERPGFLGYFLNVGYVTINVGEAQFTFNDVFEPARVQQDIFNRMHALRMQKQKEEIARERDRVIKILEIYHQEVDRERRNT